MKTSPLPTKTPPLSPGDIVSYENDGQPLLAVVLDQKKEKFRVLNERGREMELTTDRLYSLNAKLPAEYSTSTARTSHLSALANEAHTKSSTIEIHEVWSAVVDENRTYTCRELSELYFTNGSLNDHLALRFALLSDKIYFKRHREDFEPRPKAIALELTRAEELRKRKLELQDLTVQSFLALKKDPKYVLPREIVENVELLEDVAAGNESLDNGKHREARELVTLLAEKLHAPLHGSPQARAYQLLRFVGHFTERTNLTILRMRPPIEFSPEVEAEASAILAKLCDPKNFSHGRVDLTGLRTITIDDASTRDMDDALSIEQIIDGFRVGVHISDVASMIPHESLLDRTIRGRATSIYCPDRTVHMLPLSLAQDGLSLIQGVARPCLSCLFEFDREFKLRKREIKRSYITVNERLTYEEVDRRLDAEDFDLTTLYSVAAAHEISRVENGGMRIAKRDTYVSLQDDGALKLIEVDEDGPARTLVAEMMIMANAFYADFAAEHSLPLAFRQQEAPDPKDIKKQFDVPEGPARDYTIRSTLKKSLVSLQPGYHATLGLARYTQATSPIRRYLDLVAQRQISTQLTSGRAFYEREQLTEIMKTTDDALGRANIITRETKRFWQLLYLETMLREQKEFAGTVIRTDLKSPIAELDTIYLSLMFRSAKPVKPGERVRLKITSLDPAFDTVRLEQLV